MDTALQLLTESLPHASFAAGGGGGGGGGNTTAAITRDSFMSDGRRRPSSATSSSPSQAQDNEFGANGAAAAVAAGWVPRVPAGVEAHPGQVNLMQRCLMCVRCLCGRVFVLVSTD